MIHVRPRYFAALLLALCLFFLYGAKAHAQAPACAQVASNRAHVCWSPVTAYTDGTAIPTTATVTYTIHRSVNGAWVSQGTTTATEWTSEPLAAGTYTYAVSASVNGISSARSSSGRKTATEPVPVAPSITIARVIIDQDGSTREERVATLDLGYPYVIRAPLGTTASK